MKRFNLTVASLLIFVISVAAANDTKVDPIVYRQSVYHVIQWHWSPMTEMIKGRKPFDSAEFLHDAQLVESLSRLPLAGFVPTTEKDVKTKALPEIWKKWDDFKMKMENMQQLTTALVSAARSGDMPQIKKGFLAVARACKSCHDDYRE